MARSIEELIDASFPQHYRDTKAALLAMTQPEQAAALSVLIADPDPERRVMGLYFAKMYARDRIAEYILPLLSDAVDYVRRHACEASIDPRAKSVAKPVADLLVNDPDEIVRSLAACALGYIGDESVLPALRHAINHDTGTNHEDQPISGTAMRSLVRILEAEGENPSV